MLTCGSVQFHFYSTFPPHVHFKQLYGKWVQLEISFLMSKPSRWWNTRHIRRRETGNLSIHLILSAIEMKEILLLMRLSCGLFNNTWRVTCMFCSAWSHPRAGFCHVSSDMRRNVLLGIYNSYLEHWNGFNFRPYSLLLKVNLWRVHPNLRFN